MHLEAEERDHSLQKEEQKGEGSLFYEETFIP